MLFHVLGHFCERSAGKENFVDAFALHLPGVVVRDRAAAATENRDVVCPFLLQLANDIGKKIDMTAVVTGYPDRSHVFLNSRAHDIADITMKYQVNDFNYVADPEGKNNADAKNVAQTLADPLVIECDVSNPAQVESMMMEIGDKRGALDVLVNNSGIIRDRTIKKMTLEEFESVLRVNLTGTFNVTKKAVTILRNGGRVINLSSVSGQMGLFGQANYSSSKAAIIALTKVSARELARNQITVNAVAPGFID